MKYIKKIFESAELTKDTLKIIDDFGYTEKDYEEMIRYLSIQQVMNLSSIRDFFDDMYDDDDYNINSYEKMRKMDKLYCKLKGVIDKFEEEVEDYLLALREDHGMTLVSYPSDNKVVIQFDFENLSDISNKISLIEKRLVKGEIKYSLVRVSDNFGVGHQTINKMTITLLIL